MDKEHDKIIKSAKKLIKLLYKYKLIEDIWEWDDILIGGRLPSVEQLDYFYNNLKKYKNKIEG